MRSAAPGPTSSSPTTPRRPPDGFNESSEPTRGHESGRAARPKLRSRKHGAAIPLDELDKRLLNLMQGQFPIAPRPVRSTSPPQAGIDRGGGDGRGSSELLDERIIRQVTPIFDTRALGYSSMLVAAKVDPENPWRAANDHQRAPRASRTTTCATTSSTSGSRSPPSPTRRSGSSGRSRCSREHGRRRVDPPAADAEAVQDPDGPRDGGRRPRRWPRRSRSAPPAETERQPYDEFDIAVIRALQGDMPVIAEPYAPAADRARDPAGASCSTHLRGDAGAPAAAPRGRDPVPPPRRLQRQRHGRLEGPRRADHGARPADGRRSAASRTATSAPPTQDWPYSVFTMAHGRSKEECDAILDSIADRHRDRRARDAVLLDRVQEDPAALLHRRLPGLGTRARRRVTPSSATTDTSLIAALRARPALLPGGVNSPVRAMRSIGRDPIFIASGSGATITRRRRQRVRRLGLLVGSADPRPRRSRTSSRRSTAAAARGTTFGAPTAGEVELAEEVATRIPSVEMLRMTSSGTEATMSAIRLARAVTGREQVLKFAGAYHGHVDGLLAEAGSGLATQGIPASPGVPAGGRRGDGDRRLGTTPRPWSRPPSATSSRRSCSSRCRPTWASCRPRRGSWSCCASGRTSTGALLIFDEVITGFRVARGGAQERYGVLPDLTIMGKIIGGGLPGGRLRRPPRADGADRAGRRRLPGRDAVGQPARGRGRRWPRSRQLDDARLRRGWQRPPTRSPTACARPRRAAGRRGPGPERPRAADGVLLRARRSATTPAPRRATLDAYGAWCRALLARGVYPPPSQFEAWFPSLAHTDADVERTVRPPARRSPRSRRDEDRARRSLALRDALARQGGTAGRDAGDRRRRRRRGSVDRPGPAQLAAAGPRAAGHEREYELLLEMILEGSRLHYGEPAGGPTTDDPDLALLLGDQLYALGLSRLAALGDLDAVAELADVISLARPGRMASRIATLARGGLGGRRGRRSDGARARAHERGQGPGAGARSGRGRSAARGAVRLARAGRPAL